MSIQLPLLDHSRLSVKEEWSRAHLLLAAISHAYVWCEGEEGVAKVSVSSNFFISKEYGQIIWFLSLMVMLNHFH